MRSPARRECRSRQQLVGSVPCQHVERCRRFAREFVCEIRKPVALAREACLGLKASPARRAPTRSSRGQRGPADTQDSPRRAIEIARDRVERRDAYRHANRARWWVEHPLHGGSACGSCMSRRRVLPSRRVAALYVRRPIHRVVESRRAPRRGNSASSLKKCSDERAVQERSHAMRKPSLEPDGRVGPAWDTMQSKRHRPRREVLQQFHAHDGTG